MDLRHTYLDNLCGILMIHIIMIVHQSDICGFDPRLFYYIEVLLSFFMSWFFYKGGMFFRQKGLRNIVQGSFSRLLIPFFLMLGLGFVIDYFTLSFASFPEFLHTEFLTIRRHSIVWPVAPSWFLLTLFLVRIAFSCLHRWKVALPVSLVLSPIVAYGCYYLYYGNANITLWGGHQLYIPYYAGTFFWGLFFYGLGYFMKEKQENRWLFWSCMVLFAVKFFVPAFIDVRSNNTMGSSYLLAFIYAISGIFVANFVCSRFLNRRIPVLTYIGQHSMLFYLLHFPLMYIVWKLDLSVVNGWMPWLRYCLMSVYLIAALFAIDRLKRFFG